MKDQCPRTLSELAAYRETLPLHQRSKRSSKKREDVTYRLVFTQHDGATHQDQVSSIDIKAVIRRVKSKNIKLSVDGHGHLVAEKRKAAIPNEIAALIRQHADEICRQLTARAKARANEANADVEDVIDRIESRGVVLCTDGKRLFAIRRDLDIPPSVKRMLRIHGNAIRNELLTRGGRSNA